MREWWMWTVIGYACGSIPFSLLFGFAKGIDLRKVGSGNVGATNATRHLGKRIGAACLLLDVAKGFVPVFFAGQMLDMFGRADASAIEAWRWLAVGAAAVVGHVFPIWLAFRGGKGVATSLGVLLGYWPVLTVPGLAALGTWYLFLTTFRYAGLASVAAAVSLPLYMLAAMVIRERSAHEYAPYLFITTGLAVLVVIRHLGNIRRMIAGVEPRVGEGKS